MTDLLEDLRNAWREPFSTAHDPRRLLAMAADEIERLRLAILCLADQDATLSVCNGNVTVTMDATLTDAERKAITALLDRLRVNDAIDVELAATLRGLLERTQ